MIEEIKLNKKTAEACLRHLKSTDLSSDHNIGYQEGYIRALHEVLDMIEDHKEYDHHMETICKSCGKEFKLNYDSVYTGFEEHPPHDQVAVIKCPHCKKRTEI